MTTTVQSSSPSSHHQERGASGSRRLMSRLWANVPEEAS